jgi:hypothetical protein
MFTSYWGRLQGAYSILEFLKNRADAVWHKYFYRNALWKKSKEQRSFLRLFRCAVVPIWIIHWTAISDVRLRPFPQPCLGTQHICIFSTLLYLSSQYISYFLSVNLYFFQDRINRICISIPYKPMIFKSPGLS